MISPASIDDPIYGSILFQGMAFGWAGPAFVAAAVVGALLSLRRGAGALRVAAWVLLATIATLLVAVAALFVVKDWILPPPIYVEIAFWPLYGVFAAVALCRLVELTVTRLAAKRFFARHSRSRRVVVAAACRGRRGFACHQ